MERTGRQRLIEHLLEVTKDKPVERQLREQWLAELARYKLNKLDSNDVVKSISKRTQEGELAK